MCRNLVSVRDLVELVKLSFVLLILWKIPQSFHQLSVSMILTDSIINSPHDPENFFTFPTCELILPKLNGAASKLMSKQQKNRSEQTLTMDFLFY